MGHTGGAKWNTGPEKHILPWKSFRKSVKGGKEGLQFETKEGGEERCKETHLPWFGEFWHVSGEEVVVWIGWILQPFVPRGGGEGSGGRGDGGGSRRIDLG